MKLFFLLILLLKFAPAKAEETQDIVLKTRFDYDSSYSFIKRLRSFLINNNLGDPYQLRLKRPIVIDLAQKLDDVSDETRAWIQEFQKILQLKLFESKYNLVVEGLSYNVTNFNPEFSPVSGGVGRVDYVTLNHVQGLQLEADRISFEIELKKTQSGQPISFSLSLIHPEFHISPEVSVELPMQGSTSITPSNLVLSVESINLQKVFSKIVERPDLIGFTLDDLELPETSIIVGSRELTFDRNKIKDFLARNQNEMKIAILDLLKTRMQGRFGNIIKDSPQVLELPRTYQIKSKIHAIFDIERMLSNQSGITQVDMDAHFCPKGVPVTNFCHDDQVVTKRRRPSDPVAFERTMREVNRRLVERKANIAVSVSEHYVNQLIQATVQAGLWQKELAGKDFSIGSESAFILAEERGPYFGLYLDVIYRLRGFRRFLVGRSEIRFPVKFQISLKIIDKDGIPQLQIFADKATTTPEMILKGIPDYGLPTTVPSARFKKMIVKSVLKVVREFEGANLIELDLNEFKDTYLDQLSFYSDGSGRGIAILNFEKENLL